VHQVTQEQAAGPQVRMIANRYAIQREIGRGGMGVVWLAEDQMIGRMVAVKELHLPDGVPSEERDIVEQRVLREARTAGRLNDPAIVTVYDVVQENGGTFIVMELLDAPTLANVVRERGALPAEQVITLATQLLSALDTAHTAGVVHRDVKPANIMLLRNGLVKLTDFGIAQAVDDPKLTTTGFLIGSPTYMAPERIRGEEATASADLWALGAVLFFAIEGYSPFERQTTAATMHAVLNEVPYLTKVGGPLASAIMGLMVGSPQGRLTAEQARGLFQQASRGMAATDVTTPVSGFGGHGTALYQGPGTTGTAMLTQKGKRGWFALLVVVALVLGLVGGYFGHSLFTSPAPPTGPQGLEPAVTYGPGGTLTDFAIEEGSCGVGLLTGGRSLTSESGQTECDKPHDFEVLDTWEIYPRPYSSSLDPDMPFAGADPLASAASARCAMKFQAWVPAAARSTLHYQAVVPTGQGWISQQESGKENRYRVAYCLVFDANGNQLSKSVVPT
jgi:eukaryotic-like serine/threonine-protein kinase